MHVLIFYSNARNFSGYNRSTFSGTENWEVSLSLTIIRRIGIIDEKE